MTKKGAGSPREFTEPGTGRESSAEPSQLEKLQSARRKAAGLDAPEGAVPVDQRASAEHPGGPASAGGWSAELEAVTRERDDYLDALRRVQAEFENYKKRILRQQTQHLERAAEALVEKLLPVLDALDLAVAHAESSDSEDAAALRQVAAAMTDVLEKEGLERIDPKGEAFDPTAHDAVMHEEGDDGPSVSEVLRAGYCWKGRVLRPAMVKVRG